MPAGAEQSLQVGDLEVAYVTDIGDERRPPALLLPGLDLDAATARPSWNLRETYVAGARMLRLRFGGHLVRTRTTTVLVDCGVGAGKVRDDDPQWHMRTDSTFLDSLSRLGCKPDDVDVVVITHAHVDHVGWLTSRAADGTRSPTFPQARHVFSRLELEHALAAVDADPTANFGSTADSVLPLIDRVDVTGVEDGDSIAPGITARLYPGHTPGSAAVWLHSRGQAAAICGDIVHHPFQLRLPLQPSGFCTDPQESGRSRRRLLDEVVDQGAYLLPNHFRLPPLQIDRTAGHYTAVWE